MIIAEEDGTGSKKKISSCFLLLVLVFLALFQEKVSTSVSLLLPPSSSSSEVCLSLNELRLHSLKYIPPETFLESSTVSQTILENTPQDAS